ncbi:MAG: hypothetical protein GWN16_01475, partial [Calditrichae bacterium]|nr:hypothetical protein [Calditrichia bacterium]NIW78194.1 hypothetical protein [Calditrichia bacterium]
SGGPIIAPDTKALIINPICPHSLTNRPVIIPDSSVITITVRTEYSEFVIGADGRDVRYCKTRTKLSIEKAPFSAHLVKPLTSDFLDLLHQKLNWGEDFRDKKRWSHNS